MSYIAINGEEELNVEVTARDGGYVVVVGDETFELDVAGNPHGLSVLRGDSAHLALVETLDTHTRRVTLRGQAPIEFELLDRRAHQLRQAGGIDGGLSGPATIKSPMPGKVVTILVAEGDEVAEGDGVAVVEAMKMENELRAPRSGTVKSVKVKAGDTVESGAELLSIE